MLDHLLFDRFNWFKRTVDEIPSLVPTFGTIKAGTQILKYGVATQDVTLEIHGFLRAGASVGGNNQTISKITEDSFLIRDSKAPMIEVSNDGRLDSIQPVSLPVKLFTNVKWGGKRLLSHLYQALRRVVIA